MAEEKSERLKLIVFSFRQLLFILGDLRVILFWRIFLWIL